MGNCQAAEAAAVVIQHPDNRAERLFWSVTARQVMASNPGHYVALVIASPVIKSENGTPVKQLKLLRSDEPLLIGHVYRLVSFQDVLKEYAAKRCAKLGKLLKERGAFPAPMDPPMATKKKKKKKNDHSQSHTVTNTVEQKEGSNNGGRRNQQWKPALQSISEAIGN